MGIESDGVELSYQSATSVQDRIRAFKVINEDLGRELISGTKLTNCLQGLDESCYYNTISISQLGSVTDKELENILKNYAANLRLH